MEVCANCKFKPVLHILQNNGWSFTTNLANAQEHVPEAECNNHVLKECICTTYHGIPYKLLPQTIRCYMVMETAAKLNYFPTKGGCSNYFSPREILHHVKLNYKKHCSVPLLSYVLTHNEPTLTNTAHVCALDCLFLCAIHMKQGGYECYHISTHQVITQPYITVIPTTPTLIMTINALGKSDGIQNLKITDLCGHLLFDSTDPALFAGVDHDDDAAADTSLAGVQGNDTSLAGVPIPTETNDDDNSDEESDHTSVDPNEANDSSSKTSVHSTRSHTPVHNMTNEPPQLPPDEEEPDDIESPELETQVPVLCRSERVSIPPSDYIPQMGGKTYITNVQTKTNQNEDKSLVYNHDEARVLATVITTFNEHMECIV